MGPRQSSQTRSKQQQFFSNYEIIQQLPNENIRFLQHKQTKKEYLLRQLSFTDKKQYAKAIQTVKAKSQQLKDANHIAPITQYLQKQQDQYCSTFYKLYVLFQYPQRTLDDEINERNLRKNNFTQTELWSILASSILGLSHLQRKGIKHGCLKSSMIFLSQEGHIKISDPYTTGCQTNYQVLLNKRNSRHIYLSPQQCQALQSQVISPTNINPYKSDIFTLGMVILQCGLLQYQDECYRDEYSRIHLETLEYNKNRFRKMYSGELAEMVQFMLGEDVTSRPQWIQLQNYVVTDNTIGRSFISQGRKSLTMGGQSKPVSVNVQNIQSVQNNKLFTLQRSQANNSHINSSIQQNGGINSSLGNGNKQMIQHRTVSNSNVPMAITNKGIGISSSKTGSVQKFPTNNAQTTNFLPRQGQFSNSNTVILQTQFRPLSMNTFQNIVEPMPYSNFKQKSILTTGTPTSYSNIPNFVAPSNFNYQQQQYMPVSSSDPLNGNFPPSVSNLPKFSKPYIAQSPMKSQFMTKNLQIQPANVSNISNTRPFRSLFPNPFYETKTKVDENLVQMQEDQQHTSRTVSQKNSQFIAGNKINQNQHVQNNDTNNFTPKPINQYNPTYKNTSSAISNQNSPLFSPSSQLNSHKKQFQGEFVMQTFKLGSRYQGYKLNGMRHGPGKFFYQDGGMYDGDWVRNKMQGYGKLYYQSGKIAYQGEWVQDQFTGKGVLYNENPDSMSQPFDYENFDNVEELWTKYEGYFSQDSKNGKGVLYLSNGEHFEGNFLNDTAQGQGVYTNIYGHKIRGSWENNVLERRF